ncbi:hypothetical protein EIN_005510 [Entamoeba invadens IP1]|uniref:Uncharacterized protein n=1 Tax=Entamoeba invadens IP1 TaxID=370355 RepID=A0A0A1UGT1_ENTIV|nr:hypothetical protein EIN_005510 [Entamoeba invadens IP1]ELP93660.1 hypothetical protein EIN_005510 [Entamoeba invadens IP1]|eukprot:XP_004260431.1 hypothetical protein EIN_005510 [Entamoeba invadens IP1]
MWWVFVMIILFAAFVIFLLIIVVFEGVKTIQRKMNKNPTTTIFHMKNSNVRFTTIRGGLCCNLSEIDFNSEIEEIPVDKEIRQLLCVGNSKERAVKIQFTLKEQNEKFRLRMNPEIVTLKRGYACEVETLLLIQCTLKIKSEVLIVSKNLQTNLDIFIRSESKQIVRYPLSYMLVK